MTETSSLLTTTYSLHNSYPVTALPVSVSPLPNGNVSPPPVEEEEYTIKCICGYNDDDGATVFCEKCDTWQHIDCYYHGGKVPEVHYCTECAPVGTFSNINAEKARDRQRKARELLEGGGDRKVKRPASKGQKKKHRDTVSNANADNLNGVNTHDRHDSLPNGKDQPPPAKKAKTSHRPSASVASINGDSRKRAYSNLQSYPSPSKSPQDFHRFPFIPRYTLDFAQLYDRDEGNTLAVDNEQTIQGSLALSKFRNDPSMVADHLDSPQADKARYIRLDHGLSTHSMPPVSVDTIANKDAEVEGYPLKWKLLRLQSDVTRNTIVGEIKGQITTLEEYCQQVTGPNRWMDLSHPDPFVFFHQHMNICIDSRKSGTSFRYIRRSCDPNVTLKTFITPDDELHHCFVARHDIPSDTELTVSWYLPPQFHVTDMAARDEKDQLTAEWCEYISRILANFGDCACNSQKCRLGPSDRRSTFKSLDPPKSGPGRKKKSKAKAVSPTGTAHATNSRAGSEAIRGHDEDEEDRKSTSPSSGHGPQSRDMTPQTGALLDEPPVLGVGLTQREMRKIQLLEKAQKEQSQKGEKKQKKRPSGATVLQTGPPGKDSKQNSGSPPPAHQKPLKDISNRSTPAKQVKPPRPVYVSIAVQTDAPAFLDTPPVKRRKFCTPTQKLLKTVLHHRAQHRALSTLSPELRPETTSREDVDMKDATTSVSSSPSITKSPPILESPAFAFSPTPLPSQAAHTQPVHDMFKIPAPKPNLSSLPPVPPFLNTVNPEAGKSPSTISPTPAPPTNSTPSLVQPSPVKKKLSLGDYMSRRKESATPTSEKPVIQFPESEDRLDSEALHRSSDAARSDISGLDVTKVKSAENEQAVEDMPMPDADEKARDKPNGPSAEVQSVLASLQTMQNRQQIGSA